MTLAHFSIQYQTIAKNDGMGTLANEDSLKCEENRVIISDGAGGTGLFADNWSAYLCDNISVKPIQSFEALCLWQENIWERFYNQYKPIAEQNGLGGKFLEEGSSATLVALWTNKSQVSWCVYGDSVLFHFGKKKLKFSSIHHPLDFNKSPWLLNWKDSPDQQGLQIGKLKMAEGDKLILASDTLAQYILIAWLVSNPADENKKKLSELALSGSRLAKNYHQMVEKGYKKHKFFEDILAPLLKSLNSQNDFEQYMQLLYHADVLGLDDYTLASLEYQEPLLASTKPTLQEA